jgi:hypothetical protein
MILFLVFLPGCPVIAAPLASNIVFANIDILQGICCLTRTFMTCTSLNRWSQVEKYVKISKTMRIHCKNSKNLINIFEKTRGV